MANVHITLVGKQTYPVYLGIAETSPDRVILVHSSTSIAEAQRVAEEFGKAEVEFDYVELDPVNVMEVLHRTFELAQSLSDEDYYTINLTSGTKVWSILFHEAFESKSHIQFIYVDQICTVYDLSNGEILDSAWVEMERVFRLNNTSVLNSLDFKDLTTDDLNNIKTIRSLHQANWAVFTELTVPKTRDGQNAVNQIDGTFSFKGSSISWDHGTNSINFQLKPKKGLIEHEIIERTLSSPHIFDMVFNAGWFEAEVARQLSLWSYSHEVKLNVEFPYKDGNTKNEIDVIVNTGKRLLFVECKTQINNHTDLDKFSNAVKNYGGTGCLAMFVTFGSMTQMAKEKCRDSSIIPFSFKDALDAATEDAKKGAITTALHQLLDERLFTINK